MKQLLQSEQKKLLQKLVSIFGNSLAVIFFCGLVLIGYHDISDALFRSRISRGSEIIFVETKTHGYLYDFLPDSLAKNANIKTVQKTYSLEILTSNTGDSAWYFKPIPNTKAHSGICIEENGTIHSYIRNPISTFEECRESDSTGQVGSILKGK